VDSAGSQVSASISSVASGIPVATAIASALLVSFTSGSVGWLMVRRVGRVA
jgi:hypothetical protein